MIYLDHAASSWPKPMEVSKAVAEAIEEYAANPGRGGHALARRASQKVQEVRQLVAQFINAPQAQRVVFTPSATVSLNVALKGYPFEAGDQVIATVFEHNAVRRPLEWLKRERQVEVTYVDIGQGDDSNLETLKKSITEKTKMIVVSHASNVTGAIAPLEEIAELAKQHQLILCVDAAQTAGLIPIDVQKTPIQLLALAGHKGLLGPQGVGCLYVAEQVKLMPIIHGGTGAHSFDAEQPEQMPERLEAGTINTPGIAGLGEGIKYIQRIGMEKIQEHKHNLLKYTLAELQKIKEIEIYGPDLGVQRAGVISFNLKGVQSHEVAMILDQHYDIAVRAGVHCAPLAHQALKTVEQGAIRVSFGYTNTLEEMERFIQAIQEISAGLLGGIDL